MEGVPIAFHLECNSPDWRQMVWYDRQRIHGGTQLQFDSIRPTTLRPFGLMLAGRSVQDQTIEVRIGLSLRGTEQDPAHVGTDT